MSTVLAERVVEANWQEKTGEELADALGATFRVVRDENEWRTDKDEYHWGLYEGDGEGDIHLSSRKSLTYLNATLPDNVCKMGVDTLTAKVATVRPIPQVLTSKGNWKDQRKGRKLRQLIQGEFYRQGVHEKIAPRIIKDALVARGGVVQVYAEGRRPVVERCHVWTLFTDDWDAEFGAPAAFFRLRTMDRRKAIAKYGKTADLKERLKSAGRFSSSTSKMRDEERSSTVDRIELLEAWYRCVDHDEDDPDHECTGKHAIICDGATLEEGPWKRASFPFAMLTYDTPNTGYWGTGMVQTMEGYQYNIDRANEKLDESYDKSGTLVLLRDGGGVFETHVVDNIRVGHVRPGPYEPIVQQLDYVNEHMRMRVPELIERALNAVGVSQMAAQSKKPAGVDAAVALQTLDDIESQRHIVFGRRFESWCMDVARLLVETIKDIAAKYGDYAVKVPLKGAYLALKWSDVHVDGFQLEMQSVGQLFTSFAGRIQKLQTMFDQGWIDGDTLIRHMDAGDLQSEIELKLAPKMLVDEMIEAMLDVDGGMVTPVNDNQDPDGYITPSGYLPLEWAMERVQLRRIQAEMEGAPQEVLDLLGRFYDDLDYLDKKAKGLAQGPQTAGVPAGGPPLGGAPPPAPVPPPPDGGGMPILPTAVTPAGDQLMQPPPGAMPPIAA